MMCYVSYRQAVEEAVATRTAQGTMFTAYDITRDLRVLGFKEPHAVLKEVVHCLFRHEQMDADYTRTFCTVADALLREALPPI